MQELINNISSHMFENQIFHMRNASQMRLLSKGGMRGYSQWHEAQSKLDAEENIKINKLFSDNLGIEPQLNLSKMQEVLMHKISNTDDFKKHFNIWKVREEYLVEWLNQAIEKSRYLDKEIYHKLMCIAEDVENEIKRIKIAHDRLSMGGWSGADVAYVSETLHAYFEKEYNGEKIDFNIG